MHPRRRDDEDLRCEYDLLIDSNGTGTVADVHFCYVQVREHYVYRLLLLVHEKGRILYEYMYIYWYIYAIRTLFGCPLAS